MKFSGNLIEMFNLYTIPLMFLSIFILDRGEQYENPFFDEELMESDMLYHMETPPYLLFISISSVYPYVKYEEQSADINDYHLLILNTLKSKIEKKRIRDLEFHIITTHKCCRCVLRTLLSEEISYLKKMKTIRNHFVHREWEQIGKFYDTFRLCKLFGVLSSVLEKTERAACQAGILSK